MLPAVRSADIIGVYSYELFRVPNVTQAKGETIDVISPLLLHFMHWMREMCTVTGILAYCKLEFLTLDIIYMLERVIGFQLCFHSGWNCSISSSNTDVGETRNRNPNICSFTSEVL